MHYWPVPRNVTCEQRVEHSHFFCGMRISDDCLGHVCGFLDLHDISGSMVVVNQRWRPICRHKLIVLIHTRWNKVWAERLIDPQLNYYLWKVFFEPSYGTALVHNGCGQPILLQFPFAFHTMQQCVQHVRSGLPFRPEWPEPENFIEKYHLISAAPRCAECGQIFLGSIRFRWTSEQHMVRAATKITKEHKTSLALAAIRVDRARFHLPQIDDGAIAAAASHLCRPCFDRFQAKYWRNSPYRDMFADRFYVPSKNK